MNAECRKTKIKNTMKNFSNKYIFIYATILVVVVAVVLSVAAMLLKPRQQANAEKEKMQSLLSAIGVRATLDETPELYGKYFLHEMAINLKGDEVETEVAPFDIDIKKQLALAEKGGDATLPIFVFEKDGRKGYVVPLYGAGLWGDIWGYVALNETFDTVLGVTFGHESETPGLGAEITTEKFRNQFVGKKILDGHGVFTSVKVVKHADEDSDNQVDALSGATITSTAVSTMLEKTLGRYRHAFAK